MAAESQEMGATAGAAVPAPVPVVDLPVRTAKKEDTVPPPGQALTGKQEHCESRRLEAPLPSILCDGC